MCPVEIKLNIDCAEDDHHHVCLPLCHGVRACVSSDQQCAPLVNICNAGKATAAAHLPDDRTSHQPPPAAVQKNVVQQCGRTGEGCWRGAMGWVGGRGDQAARATLAPDRNPTWGNCRWPEPPHHRCHHRLEVWDIWEQCKSSLIILDHGSHNLGKLMAIKHQIK